MILPEYGRSIQQMVNHAITIQDKDERALCIRTIIHSMGNLFPHLRDGNDAKQKLWDHLVIMSNFELAPDSPYENPSIETYLNKPEKIAYNQGLIRQMHYGRIVEVMIEKVLEFEEGEEKEQFILATANQMKKNFVLWNKENVDDAKILKDLYYMSKGKIDVKPEELELYSSKDILGSKPRNNNTNNNNNKGKGQQKRSNGGRKR